MISKNLLGVKIFNYRILCVWIFVFTALLYGCNAEKPKVYRVGVLVGFVPFLEVVKEFKTEMGKLGYVEGENIVYDLQKVNVNPADERRAIEKFVADKVDLIFVFPTSATVTAKKVSQGSNIPVVFAMAGIEGNNLVESVRHPGGFVTGVRYPGPDLTIKRFEFLQMLTTNLKRLYITYNPNYPANKIPLSVLRPTLFSLGVKLVEVPVTSVEDIRADLQARDGAHDIGMDATMIMPDDISQSPAGWAVIRKFAMKYKVPVSGAAGVTVHNGAVFNYAPDLAEAGRLAAPAADKILKGTPAGTIPVVTPEAYLRLNYKLTQELGLKVPENLLHLAQEIIR
jgi:putative ABC transport system substrate-binding protein